MQVVQVSAIARGRKSIPLNYFQILKNAPCDCTVDLTPPENNCTTGKIIIETDEKGVPLEGTVVVDENELPTPNSAKEAKTTEKRQRRSIDGKLAGIIIGSILAASAAVFVLIVAAAIIIIAIILKRRYKKDAYFVNVNKRSFQSLGNEIIDAVDQDYKRSVY